MARSEIADKLNTFLGSNNLIWNEQLLVYFLVEIRKLLDYKRTYNKGDLPHLRFYCDWIVHTSKDRIDITTFQLLQKIQDNIEQDIKHLFPDDRRGVKEYIYFDAMKDELLHLLRSEDIDFKHFTERRAWLNFVATLVKVLESQPLRVAKKYKLNIKDITFFPAADRCVSLRISLINPVVDRSGTSYSYYIYKNAY